MNPLYMVWLRNKWERLVRTFGWLPTVVLVALATVFVLVFILILELGVIGLVTGLIWYLDPDNKLSIANRKALVQGIASVAQAAAVGLAGAVGLGGLFFTWRSLRQARESQEQTQENTRKTLELTEQGQITERFTRAIDQLGATDETTGKPRLEIRLGGIYALERIARDSPERDYSTVMEVLTAYVRENTQAPGPSEGSSDEASLLDSIRRWLRSTAKADEGTKQPAPPEPLRPSADIQAILDVLRRRQARVPEKYRTRFDLHEANLQEANLQNANLFEANLQGANLSKANLFEADLSGASLRETDLREANLLGANLRRAGLSGANLRGAMLFQADLSETNLERASLVEADLGKTSLTGAYLRKADLTKATLSRAYLVGADLTETTLSETYLRNADLSRTRGITNEELEQQALSLKDATMPNGQKYEDWLKDKEGSGKDGENE
jgi:uncharacterized protein YjbI with pentapeptide repeats